MQLHHTSGTIVAKSANTLIKRLKAAGADNSAFTISDDNGVIIASAELSDSTRYSVYIGGALMRVIPRSEVVQTVRLRADALRLRRKLVGAELMVVRPV